MTSRRKKLKKKVRKYQKGKKLVVLGGEASLKASSKARRMRMPVPVKHYSYRSGTEQHWRCPRAGWLNQFYLGTGVEKSPRAYWLDVGIAVHVGLAYLLEVFAPLYDVCVKNGEDFATQLTTSGTMKVCGAQAVWEAMKYWDECGQQRVLLPDSFKEQRLLIEGLLWAFYYHSLTAFLTHYEVLWVEKEITEIVAGRPRYMMMSRPDAIVRDRETGEMVVISWKTIDDPTAFRRLFFKQDLQGMMEAWYSEQFLKHVCETCKHPESERISYAARRKDLPGESICGVCRDVMLDGVWQKTPEIPKIDYVQTIYLVKGKRERLKDDGTTETGELYEDTDGAGWRQNSFLVYPYRKSGSTKAEVKAEEAKRVCTVCRGVGLHSSGCPLVATEWPAVELPPEQLAWKWRYRKAGNVGESSLGPTWKKVLLSETEQSVESWVRLLHSGEAFPSEEEDVPPLQKVIVWEAPSKRDAEFMNRMVQQVKVTERKRHRDAVVLERYAGKLASMMPEGEVLDAGKLDSVITLSGYSQELDRLFPQQLSSCSFPWKCQFQDICHTPKGRQELYQLNMPTGYARRVPHHDPEKEGKEKV